ncbi:MAG: flagellar biosynthetic protein FliR [Candidatus Neomarinimicrobiota bacterium]|nr:MAG: flagellar biosynthetic protein FliR [Candidatus Neomarinimicrobiota bacterium]
MFDLIDYIQTYLPMFLMIFFRLLAIIMTMPVFGYQTVSRVVRLMLAVVLTIVVFMVHPKVIIETGSLFEMSFLILREILIGMILGFGARLIFEGITMAGSFIGRQTGLAIANIIDPTSQEQVPIISQFWLMLMIVYFFTVNGHQFLINILMKNMSVIPIGGGHFSAALGQTLVEGGSQAFIIAIQLAAPVIGLLLIVDTALALVARVMPQVNIFIVSLPLKLGVGIFGVISSLNIFQMLYYSFFERLTIFMGSIIRGFSGS